MARLAKYLVPVAVLAALGVWWLGQSDDPTNAELLQLIESTQSVVLDSEYDGCFECHDDVEQGFGEGGMLVASFSHGFHGTASGGVGCANCHVQNPHEVEITIRPTMEDCLVCHGATADAPLPCLECHTPALVAPPPSHFGANWQALHSTSASAGDAICETCHSRENFCVACHGVDLPHGDDWFPYEHARTALTRGIATCENCHERGPQLTSRDLCDACHHPQLQEIPRWLDAHFEIVKSEGGATCFECHDPNTCAECHSTGSTDFLSDLNRLEVPENGG